MKNIADSVAFITGASSGIGAAVALDFARRGADTVLAARRRDRLEEVAQGVRDLGRRPLVVECDVATNGHLERAVSVAVETFGRIDWVVANAGFGVGGPLVKLTLDDYRRQFETNVFGVLRTVFATREALEASRGCLGIVGSVSGEVAFPKSSPYSMSKFAVRALADALWSEFAATGVAVTLIEPGFTASEIRQVDNHGVYHADRRDSMPRWIQMPTDRAARRMVTAMVRRRRKIVLTGHGKLAVAMSRLTPGLMAALIRRFGHKKPR